MSCIEQALNEVFAIRIDVLRSARRRRWREILQKSQGKLVVFGAGELGLKTIDGLLAEGIEPLAVLDNRASNELQEVRGIPVVSPERYMLHFGTDVLCLIAVYNTSRPRAQLAMLGFKEIVHCAEAFAGVPKRFLPFVCLDDTDVIFRQANLVRGAFSLMADDESRQAFVMQLRHRLFLDFDRVRQPLTQLMKNSEYFLEDVYEYLENEVLVDCGAYRGDTISRFLERRHDAFTKIYALEPDRINFHALQNYINRLDSNLARRIYALPYAVGSEKGVVNFLGDGTVRSGSSFHGSDTVNVERLDVVCSNTPPTLIKMDIEGAEPDALLGASKIIKQHSPVLAVCVYHACDHLWSIPTIAYRLNPSYKLFLRAHAEDCWDVTCYAVPKGRCVTK